MPFIRIDLLPRNDSDEGFAAQQRWATDEGRALSEQITAKIREGAGDDFLQWEFEERGLGAGILKDHLDLAGMQLFNEKIAFPKGDNFKFLDFSYAEFWHCVFNGACLFQSHFSFARLYNVTFRNCLFALTHFYGAKLEKCRFENCSFIEGNGFSNCDLIDTQFSNCFIQHNIFMDCKFSGTTEVKNNRKDCDFGLLKHAYDFNVEISRENISSIYQGIKDGFVSGENFQKVREYLFLQLQAYTRFNSEKKAVRYLWEAIAGYGLKPGRVLLTLLSAFLVFSVYFVWRLGAWSDGVLLSAGAFFTFGAKTNLLGTTLTWWDSATYIAASFAGLSLSALFVTVLANVLLKEK